jgi:hypothetical protein
MLALALLTLTLCRRTITDEISAVIAPQLVLLWDGTSLGIVRR